MQRADPMQSADRRAERRDGLQASPEVAYAERFLAMREAFRVTGDGAAALRERSAAVDALIEALWRAELEAEPTLHAALAIAAIGGYGRAELFPYSDIDLLILTPGKTASDLQQAAVRRLAQALWDTGLRVAVATERVDALQPYTASNPEGSLALLDLRLLTGNSDLFAAAQKKLHTERSSRDARALASALASLVAERYARFGSTLFHLEPNVKDTPGGLRDAHACAWLSALQLLKSSPRDARPMVADDPLQQATRFLTDIRVFLHERHGRDDNTLDWHAQDEAARLGIGLPRSPISRERQTDPAQWMRTYFRHARVVERALRSALEHAGVAAKPPRSVQRLTVPRDAAFIFEQGVLHLNPPRPTFDPAEDPDTVLQAFGLLASTGATMSPTTEDRIAAAVPTLAAHLEDGPRLWTRLRPLLMGAHAAGALRTLHALGVLDLIVPEFHGIDALVIRDAYHRYTVDEHTFVLIDVLHRLGTELAPVKKGKGPAAPAPSPDWGARFRQIFHDLPHPDLLFLAALLHDTGKARAATGHAAASVQLAERVCARLELEPYQRTLVTHLIDNHLEMSVALRRDIFDPETIRVFAEKVQTHEQLRMLTLFTCADISAVHPDAFTPWKAENLWRLFMATANQLDRTVDQERVSAHPLTQGSAAEQIARALGLSHSERTTLEAFLEGLPERYLRSHTPAEIAQHLRLAAPGLDRPILLTARENGIELTVVARDRPRLFADLAAVLSAWGMNIVTGEAFSNARGLVVDTFRFTDVYRTLELNPGERDRLLAELVAALQGASSPEVSLQRRRWTRSTFPRRVVQTRLDFDDTASTRSTLLQLTTQDVPGLLSTASRILSDFGCSVEIALIDTEGEMAIDVLYLTRNGKKLTPDKQAELRALLLTGLESPAI